MAKYVCHRTNRLTEGGGTTVLVHCGMDQYAVPVQGLKHLEATAIHVMQASKPVKILAVFLSPSWPLFASDLSACLGGSLPTLMADDLNSKHVDWNSRLITIRGRLLRDYADENCLIYGLKTPTTLSYNSSATPDVLDIVLMKDLVTPV